MTYQTWQESVPSAKTKAQISPLEPTELAGL